MGLDIETTRYLLKEYEKTIKNKNVLMIGRQTMEMGCREFEDLLNDFHLSPSLFKDIEWQKKRRPYSEPFFKVLGAKSIKSMDFSDYEGAELIHDLNNPVSKEFERRFDFICESGSLEHIFNFPVAVSNLMKMLKVGGRFTWAGPANNFFGHGFYQFSPELVFRVLSPENGFRIEKVYVVEYSRNRPWYRVIDPALKGDRVKLVNDRPVNLLVTAEKVSDEILFKNNPLQSDYLGEWTSSEEERKSAVVEHTSLNRLRSFKNFVIRHSPFMTRLGRSLQASNFNLSYSFRNRSSFEKIDK